MHRSLAAAQPGQAVGHRVAGHYGSLLRGLGQGQPRRQAGRECRRMGAPGAVSRGDAEPGDRDGQVP